MDASQVSPKLDLSIEGMRSQQFGEAVFAFLLVGILVFSAIVVVFWFRGGKTAPVRTGERMMFVAILLGIVAAVIFGALQMVGGILF
jgi:hypothetical protein